MPTVLLEGLTYADAAYVARRLRKWDAKEIMPLVFGGAEDLAFISANAQYGKVALFNGEPVAVVGASQVVRTVWQPFMFATDKWPKVALSVTRHIKRVMVPLWFESGANRAECRTHHQYKWAHRWLETLGARKEAVLEEYGSGRETYFLYVWRRSFYEV